VHMHAWRARKPERVALWKHESVGLWEGWGSTERRARKRPAREARTRKREHIHKLYWIAEYRKHNGVPPIFTVDCDDTR
jgi:hypothetical protein